MTTAAAAAPGAESGLQTTQPKALKPIDSVRETLERMKPQMALALPRHLTPERLARVAMTAIQNTPKLLECDRTSLFAAIMTCAQLGLEPDGVLGQAYLVPFGGKVQFIPGYRGLISLARNSGEVQSIMAQEVREHDKFEYAFGLHPRCEHVPASGERGEIVAFYAVAHFINGGHHFEVMSRAEVEKIRDNSSGYKVALRYAKPGQEPQSPWVQNFAEMGKKTVIRRMGKYLPMNVQKAAALADMYDSGRHASLGRDGEIVVEPVAGELVAGAITVAQGSAASGLDKFAGTMGEDVAGDVDVTPTTDEVGEVAPAESDAGPVLLTPARAEYLREMAAEKGVDGDQIAADLAGCGLDSMPATFETTYLRRLQDAWDSRGKSKGRR